MMRDASLSQAEQRAQERVEDLGVDAAPMAVVSNAFRVTNAIRNFSERRLLRKFDLSFSGFTVLWILWLWGPRESNVLAEGAGISKDTLTGVVKTLERLGLVVRTPHKSDGRRVYVQATDKGIETMHTVFPQFNTLEAMVTGDLTASEKESLAHALRIMLHTVEGLSSR